MSRKVKKEVPSVFREASGRFKPDHKLGGRGSRRSALTEMFADSGVSIADVRRLVLEQTIKNAKKGVDAAVERLGRLVLPASRPTPGVFKDAANASERADALLLALETGAVTANEAAMIARGPLEHLAQADDWREVAERLDRLAANPPASALGIRVVHTRVSLEAPAVDGESEPVEPSNG